MPFDDLGSLPENHPLRNIPLIDIGAFYKKKDVNMWREVFPSFNIAKKTYNELSAVWTTWDVWKATKLLELFE